MYRVTQSDGETSLCDAIETHTVVEGNLTPVERADADGFKAFTIVEVSPSEQHYDEHLYVFPDHTLDGMTGVDVGTYEETEDEEDMPSDGAPPLTGIL